MHNLIILDISAAVIMVVLANLSMRLGSALKIPPYYRIFHVSTTLVLIASLVNVIAQTVPMMNSSAYQTTSMLMRSVAGVLSVATALRYWKWLFAEYVKR
ncbi:MAG: hypothetical protein GF344_06810 [Chitinivibrionales bacterium]|nr:hypothetical protein [Chitinivibrionales bacterium]MBD3356634.1 hypothetical protein [Chitinivibrionales bacterium]